MTTLENTKKKAATDYSCEFCNRSFLRESTILKHVCEPKRRYLEKDRPGNRIGFQSWLQFYAKNSPNKKKRDYFEFIKSPYYTAFVKFGNYCVEVKALNVSRMVDWLLKNQIRLDQWNTDSVYTRFLIEYLREEDPLDAVARSIETTIDLAEQEGVMAKDVLRYGNKYKICHSIVTGKISPWMLFQSQSGIEFMEKLDATQVKMVIDYIDPEKWALKFHRQKESVSEVKELLRVGGY